MPKKKLSEQLLEALEDAASKDEVIELFNTLIQIMRDLTTTVEKKITQNKTDLNFEVAELNTAVRKNLQLVENSLSEMTNEATSVINNIKETMRSELRTIQRMIEQQLSDFKASIPEPIDFGPLEDLFEARFEEIESKIPTLPEQKDYQQAIDDLRNEIDELKKRPASKGTSGSIMPVSHWPLHESFTMDGIATTVTLSQGVGAAGTAIFGLRYQGQVQALGVDYSVNGNVITLLTFTPEADSIIDVSYMP